MAGSAFVTLTPPQALVLDALRTVGTMTLAELRALTGLGQTYLRRAHHELLALELLTCDYDRRKLQPMTLTISRTGSRALARHKRLVDLPAQDIVPPPTFNTAGTTFTPPPRSYYRNEGNAHIASRGVGC
jgi:DNA-binding MarR family transcriptional regulator